MTVLVGAVWEACSALKKTPATNVIAIGRTMTQTALSIKDVLREMKELKLENDAVDELGNKSFNPEVIKSVDTGDSSDDELGNNLSVEEMQIAQSAINLVSQVLTLVKELIRSITGIMKQETSNSSSNNTLIDTLERLLKLCRCISLQVDELGASLYPPQELSTITTSSKKISTCSDDIYSELRTLNCSSDSFLQCLNSLKNAVIQLHSDIKCSSPEACTSNLQKLTLSN